MQTSTPKLRFPEFSGDWQVKNIEDVLAEKLSNGATVPKDIISENMTDSALVQIDSLFASDLKLTLDNIQYLKIPIKERKLNNMDVIINRVSIKPSGVGKVVIVEEKPKNLDLFYESNMFRLRFDETKYVPKFFAYFGKTNQYAKQKLALARVGNQASLSQSDINSIALVFGSTTEQEKIADFLTVVDDRVTAQQQKVELLKKYKKGVMQKIFTQQIRFKDNNGQNYPGWQEKKLGDIVTFHRGNLLSKSDINGDGEYKCVHYGELFTEYAEVIDDVKSRTNLNTGSKSESGDILMPTSDVTPQGLARASVIKEVGVMLGGDINILRPNSQADPIFLSYLLNLQKKKIMRLVSGTTVRHIYSKDITKIIYKIPKEVKEQQKIANFLTSLDDKIELEETKLEQAKNFKKGLLQRMFV